MDNFKLDSIATFLSKYEMKSNPFGLIGGDLGRLLFFFYYAEHSNSQYLFDKAIQETEWCIENIGTAEHGHFSFCNGLSGFGWFIEHIAKEGWIELDTNEILNDVDELLSSRLKLLIHEEDFDFLHGGVGIGLYYTTRVEKNTKVRKHLEELALGILRNIKSDSVSPFNYEVGKQKVKGYNLGLAHGIPSIISLLVKLYNIGILPEQVSYAIKVLTNFILKQQLDLSKSFSYFPSSVSTKKEERVTSSRLAWCYGDLGICCALWQVGATFKNDTLIKFVRQVLSYSATRQNPENSMIVDACFCHGTAGTAHIFQRFFELTGEQCLKQAAEFWYHQTVDNAKHADGYVGYKSYRTAEFGGWQPSINLLEGISGIGLVLLYKATGKNPFWEQSMLIS